MRNNWPADNISKNFAKKKFMAVAFDIKSCRSGPTPCPYRFGPISCQKKRRKNSGSKWPFSTSFLVMKYAQESVQKSCSNSLSIPAVQSFYFSALVSINTQLQMARLCKDRSLIFINKMIIFWRSRGASEEAFVARIFSFSVLATDCTKHLSLPVVDQT